MPLSMTGYGDARVADDNKLVAVEIRTVNNRYLKVSIRCPDFCTPLESRIEKTIRESIIRGTVTATVRIESSKGASNASLDIDQLRWHWESLKALSEELNLKEPTLESLLVLPDLVQPEQKEKSSPDQIWKEIETPLRDALDKLRAFREEEGGSMKADLEFQCTVVEKELDPITRLAPQVVVEFRERILDRIKLLLENTNAEIENNDLIREVSIFADRCDINEEITRLRCHLTQMKDFLNQTESQGRKLEFLCQEMLREVNTIGSKANHIQIAHGVVEMKSAVEKMREIVQNIE